MKVLGWQSATAACRFFERGLSYADISSANRRTNLLIDGWGIHWIPAGVTLQLVGFSWRNLVRAGAQRSSRLDDAVQLVEFLKSKRPPSESPASEMEPS